MHQKLINKMDYLNSISPQTIHHMIRVGRYAESLAYCLGLDEYIVSLAFIGGTVHDIGKSEINNDVLNKPGRLTDEEFEIMKEHTSLGFKLYEKYIGLNNDMDKHIGEIILYHHESVNGSGYHKLKQSEIPLLAQLVAICDSFDAMTEQRVYKRGMPIELAIEELQKNRNIKYNSKMVDTFVEGLQSGKIPYLD